MLAHIKLNCANSAPSAPFASDVIVLVWSLTEEYITDIEAKLRDKDLLKSLMRTEPDVHLLKGVTEERDYERLLRNSGQPVLLNDMKNPSQWIAYRVPIKLSGPTPLPLPTEYERTHRAHLLVVTKEYPKEGTPEVNALQNLTGVVPKRLDLQELLVIEIAPKEPQNESYLTDMGIELFPGNRCWQPEAGGLEKSL
jgi:hypothetical protein